MTGAELKVELAARAAARVAGPRSMRELAEDAGLNPSSLRAWVATTIPEHAVAKIRAALGSPLPRDPGSGDSGE